MMIHVAFPNSQCPTFSLVHSEKIAHKESMILKTCESMQVRLSLILRTVFKIFKSYGVFIEYKNINKDDCGLQKCKYSKNYQNQHTMEPWGKFGLSIVSKLRRS